MIIYKISNLVNDKIYIGQTIETLDKRWKRHTWKSTIKRNVMAITNAIIKYGVENFIIEEIDNAENIDELNMKEEYYIKYYDCISPKGYNIKHGGDNKKLSEETKLKISISNKGKKRTEETIKKLSDSHKGWTPSEETKQKWRDAFGGKRPSNNTINAAIEAHQKEYTLLNPDGEIITFINMAKFCRENNLLNSKLCLVASGKIKCHKGWTKPI
jgi:group I intron endonuclease